jgi:uncharacterized protein
MEDSDIVIHNYKDLELKGATVINGFPTRGLVSTIVANYLISELDMDQVGAIDSNMFPPISMIYESKPKFPARIYADEKTNMAVFLSEFTPAPDVVRPIASRMISWAREKGCHRVIAPEVVIVRDEAEALEVFGVGSTEKAREEIEGFGINPLHHGMISVIESIAKFMPMEINVEPLYKEAEEIEEFVKLLRKQAESAAPPSTTPQPPDMYR